MGSGMRRDALTSVDPGVLLIREENDDHNESDEGETSQNPAHDRTGVRPASTRCKHSVIRCTRIRVQCTCTRIDMYTACTCINVC